MNDRIDRNTELPCLTTPSGLALRGYLSFSGQVGPAAVLFVHGFGSRRDGDKAAALEEVCAARGWTFAAFNFRGHADSDGTFADLRGAGLQEDLACIRDYLAQRGVDLLFLVGSSMGGWASAWFAARQPTVVPACVLIAPAFAFPGVRWERLPEAEQQAWRERRRAVVRNESRGVDEELDFALVEEIADFQPGVLASMWTTPLLIFHGLLDDVVPWTHSSAFIEQAAGAEIALVLLKNGDHRLNAYRNEMADATGQFFARYWPQSEEPHERFR